MVDHMSHRTRSATASTTPKITSDTEPTEVELAKAGIFFPFPRPSRPTLFRWASIGVRVEGWAEPVKLKTRRIGRRRFVARAFVEAFIEAQNESPDQPAPVSNAQRQRQQQSADEILRAAGL